MIKDDLDKIAASVLGKTELPDVFVSEPSDQMLPSSVTDTVA